MLRRSRTAIPTPEAAATPTPSWPASGREVEEVRKLSWETAIEMLAMRGSLGWVGMTIGHRMMTVTAWDCPDDPAQLMDRGAHAVDMKKHYGSKLGASGMPEVLAGSPADHDARWFLRKDDAPG